MSYAEFEKWYLKEGTGSGPGSTMSATEEWRKLVEQTIREASVDTVVDVGCGDWQHSQHIDFANAHYLGVDVSPTLVLRLKNEFGSPTRNFLLLDPDVGAAGLHELLSSPRDCPGVVLGICKDVIQHLSDSESLILLDALLSSVDLLLLVNDSCGEPNVDIEVGGCRHVDPRQPPYNLEAKELIKMCGDKIVLLVKGRRVNAAGI